MPRADRRSKTLGRYRKVYVRMWADERFLSLSAPKPNAQSLWQYLLTGPHLSAVPGVFRAGEATLAERLGWPLPSFRRCWREIEQAGMAKADWKRQVVWLPSAVKYNTPESPNVVVSWRTAMEEIPSCPIKDEAETELRSFLADMAPSFQRAFGVDDVPSSGNTSGKACPTSSGRTSGNQEQEQEQKQEPTAITGERSNSPAAEHAADRARADDGFGPVSAEPPRWGSRSTRVGLASGPHACDPATIAACRRGYCVPAFLPPRWRQQLDPDGTDYDGTTARIAAIVEAGVAKLPQSGPVGGVRPEKFWADHWADTHAEHAPPPANVKPAGPRPPIQRASDLRAQLAIRGES